MLSGFYSKGKGNARKDDKQGNKGTRYVPVYTVLQQTASVPQTSCACCASGVLVGLQGGGGGAELVMLQLVPVLFLVEEHASR